MLPQHFPTMSVQTRSIDKDKADQERKGRDNKTKVKRNDAELFREQSHKCFKTQDFPRIVFQNASFRNFILNAQRA